ncbi:hypothetical protein HAX54_006169 [Datura stramonium]|uniref:Uncharacterized protein n=1 Tax=Datura stramonium TaxID=4076 RepID=A0ABS8T9V1_DATST|nr:hypothetical protein [Datura stramonium]
MEIAVMKIVAKHIAEWQAISQITVPHINWASIRPLELIIVSQGCKANLQNLCLSPRRIQPASWSFPQNITCYEFDESNAKLIVYLPSACEVCFKDSSVTRYATQRPKELCQGESSME